MFVGSALGLSYSERETPEDEQRFTNVYITPRAYEQYRETGVFPDGTMFAMAVYRQAAKSGGLPRLQGSYEGEFLALEVSVKDRERYDDGWAYFDFSGSDERTRTAKPMPRAKCYDCHAAHAGDDNVFVQFYPVLHRPKSSE